MTDTYNKEHQLGMQQNRGLGMQQQYRGQHSTEPRAHQLVKAATAAAFGGSLVVLSGLILAGTVIALTVATPVLVIFSPVLVPAVIAVFLLVTGFLASGGFGVAAVTVLAWMYRYVTGEHPTGADTLDDTAHKIGAKGPDIRDTIRDKAEHAAGARGQHTTGAGAGAGGGIYT